MVQRRCCQDVDQAYELLRGGAGSDASSSSSSIIHADILETGTQRGDEMWRLTLQAYHAKIQGVDAEACLCLSMSDRRPHRAR
jgi:hypothetical protein